MLDDRKADILRAVVQEYIQTAQPVGSSHAARLTEVSVSSATVRNEMAALEREGYLDQPHTSAGRIPTEKGYRFFVDQLTAPGTLQPAQREQVRDFFARASGELEQVLESTSRLLSGLTDQVALVVSPPAQPGATIRSVQVVGLNPHLALLVVVLSNGSVEKRMLELPGGEDEQLAAAGARLSSILVGRPLADLAGAPGTPGAGLAGTSPTVGSTGHLPTGNDGVDAVVSAALAALTGGAGGHDPDHVFVGGTSRTAAAFDAMETVRSVLGTLEQHYVVVTLLRDVLDRGLSVAIGTEHGLEPLAECSVVVASYGPDGRSAGTIGVLGPTRMDYSRALAAVTTVSRQLSRTLEDG